MWHASLESTGGCGEVRKTWPRWRAGFALAAFACFFVGAVTRAQDVPPSAGTPIPPPTVPGADTLPPVSPAQEPLAPPDVPAPVPTGVEPPSAIMVEVPPTALARVDDDIQSLESGGLTEIAAKPQAELLVAVGRSRIFELKKVITRIFLANPAIANVRSSTTSAPIPTPSSSTSTGSLSETPP